MLGKPDCRIDGPSDGASDSVGQALGSADGTLDGPLVGCFDGLGVGSTGCIVGYTEGNLDKKSN